MGAAMAGPTFEVRRVYGDDGATPGYRALVDRLWPRGVRKDELAFDEWLKDVAPSTELRRWYGHDPARFEEFARRYRDELSRPPASVAARHLLEVAGKRAVVLLTATRDVERSGACVLRDLLAEEAAG